MAYHPRHARLPKGHVIVVGVGEAVALTLEDVDLPGALITIRNTKFHKTRRARLQRAP